MESGELPLVSAVIPVRNEGRYIEGCLESLAAQDYPRSRIEIVIVDDASEDGTRELSRHYAGFGWEAFRVVDNEGRGTAAARNTGIKNSAGEVVIQLIGHCELAPDYVSTAVATLDDRQADCAGGRIETIGAGATGKAIAAALSSPFGVGNARFRTGGSEGPVDTVAFGAYRRVVFEQIGVYNEADDAGEDDELNYRLLHAGGLIWFTPALRSRYYSRSTLDGVVRQYFAYGRAKAAVLIAHPGQVRPRQLAPSALVSGLGVTLAGGLLLGRWRPLRALLRLYSSFLALGGLRMASRQPATAPLLPGVMAAVHLSYGLGFLLGVGRFLLGLRPRSR